ncbi:MAG: hypothetical protein IPG59_19445 [Candidatus Melainabacteria bacterium]|nr:MAG: hypothetical protein IPG59_19445 [Candidatus Melainabacteria bacterium]
MVKLTLCSLLLLTSCIQLPVLALNEDGTSGVPRLQPEYGIIDQSQNSAVSRIYKIEAAFFGHAYDKDNLHQRINRLENNVFGNSSYDAINDRLDRLERALGREPKLKIENPPAAKAKAKSQSAPAKDSPDKKFADMLNRAQADISLRRFHAAAEELMNAIQINPSSSLAFRQLGDVLVELKDSEGAIESYKACFENDPFGENGKYAKAKLLSLSGRNARSKMAPQDTEPVVQNTITTVNSQVRDYANRMQYEARRNSMRISRESALGFPPGFVPAYDTGGYSRRGRRGMGGGAYGFGGGGGGFRGLGGGYGPGEISDLNYLRGNYGRTDVRVRAMASQREAAQRAAYVAESATNLKDQLLRPHKKGQARLRALGTNVYVRYYGDETPSSSDEKIPEDPEIKPRTKPGQLK